MKKIAIFVEGQTESIFIDAYLRELFSRNSISITSQKFSGGRRSPIRINTINAESTSLRTEYFFLIIDCTSENNVISYINDQYSSLISSNYTKIIGLRDVYPNINRSDIPKFKNTIENLFIGRPVPVKLILCIMEIESWFIFEETHFKRINSLLDDNLIRTNIGFDIMNENSEIINNPAKTLDDIYRIVRLRYSKSLKSAKRTVRCIDIANLYLKSKLNESFWEFKTEIDSIF